MADDRVWVVKRHWKFVCIGMLAAMTCAAPPARAAFHLWSINEIYTNSSGTLQFIELVDNSGGGNNFVSGQSIHVSNSGNTQTNTFTIPGNSTLAGNTQSHTLLFGTSGLRAAGGPTPDFIIPDNFLFADGGAISFFGQNSGSYGALPSDGSLSRTWGTSNNAANSPQNYLGQAGTVVAPEPVTFALFACCGICLLRRRKSIG